MKSFNVITETERLKMLFWIFSNQKNFKQNPAGPYRKYLSFSENKNIPKIFFDVRNRIIENEKIKNYITEPKLGNMITWVSKNGFIHKHTDSSIHLYDHVRYNLCLCSPFSGGRTIYNKEVVQIKEGNYVKCHTKYDHETEIVTSFKPRICVSYGFLIYEN